MLAIERVGLEEFENSRETWNAIARAMSYPSVFCTWEWVYTWWEHFGRVYEPFVLFLRRDGELRGILPLFRETRLLRNDGKIGKILLYGGSTKVYPDHLDVICAPEDAAECLEAFLGYLHREGASWDVTQLPYISEDSAIARWGGQAPASELFIQHPVSVAPYVSITGDYESYLSQLSSNERQKIRSRRRKLLDAEGVNYVRVQRHQFHDAFESLLQLHEKRAKQKNIRSSFVLSGISAFHDSLLTRLPEDQVWLRCLCKGKTTIAAFYGFKHCGYVFYYQLGYDPDWAKHAPGAVLLQETIREAFESGCVEYNFLQGGEEFKFRWTVARRVLLHAVAFNVTACGRLSRTAHWLRHVLRRLRTQ